MLPVKRVGVFVLQDTNNNEHPQIHPSILAELKSQMRKAEEALREKEEENAILKQQLQDYETRWSEYELKMKSMEETWQKQLTALQVNFQLGYNILEPLCTLFLVKKLYVMKVLNQHFLDIMHNYFACLLDIVTDHETP